MFQITKVMGVDPWKNDHGQMFCFKLILSDGRNGEVNAKTEDRYKEGDTVWVVSEEEGQYGFKWKLSKKDPSAYSNDSNGQPTGSKSQPNVDLNITVSWAIGQVLNADPSLLNDMTEVAKHAAELMNMREQLKQSHDNG